MMFSIDTLELTMAYRFCFLISITLSSDLITRSLDRLIPSPPSGYTTDFEKVG